jgi:hypothetical protein
MECFVNTSTQIYQITQTLPISQQIELLHFAEFLQGRFVTNLTPKSNNLAQAFYYLTQLPNDCFEEDRIDLLPEEREAL